MKIFNCVVNWNYNGSIFGGRIFSAADPFYVILFDQILKRKGYKTQLWLKQANIDYVKPGTSNLYFSIHLTEENISEALHALDTAGKFIKTFPVRITNKQGIVHAIVHNEIYIRKIGPAI